MNKKKQLILLHFAGGSSYSYQFMKPYLDGFNCISLELPGRGRRMENKLLIDFDAAVFDLYQQILLNLKTSPFVVYGHSMGAYLAFRLTYLLEKNGTPPTYLFVTGSAGPKVKFEKKRYLLDDKNLLNEIKAMGGLPEEILKNKDFTDYYLPIIRADFELIEKSNLINESPVNVPIFAIMGNEEERYRKISEWQIYTTAQFNYEILEGNHFFIYRHAQYIASKIKYIYEKNIT
ncbi:alpha/beta fold hydrolase [Sphingobacterium sp. DR205]|uniref:thioesterase II family protein n=1 Tax=Sphingobacterium sp. DR205 TaxID=2713573 RepID=UPI0013E4C12A|nr:alpha/beta fold hydrolase [Sphingobacterium sp. DR205]QIH33430.1 thioesterase [Sphingobacterium sp. DR205]